MSNADRSKINDGHQHVWVEHGQLSNLSGAPFKQCSICALVQTKRDVVPAKVRTKATIKQHRFIAALVKERVVGDEGRKLIKAQQARMKAGELFSMQDATHLIEFLKKCPVKQDRPTAKAKPKQAIPGVYRIKGNFYGAKVVIGSASLSYWLWDIDDHAWVKCPADIRNWMTRETRVDASDAKDFAAIWHICIFCGNDPGPTFVYYHDECIAKHRETEKDFLRKKQS
jgi:hypothetical protein